MTTSPIAPQGDERAELQHAANIRARNSLDDPPPILPQLPEATATIRRWTTNSISVDIPPPLMGALRDGDSLIASEHVIAWGQQCYEAGVRAERERILALCAGQSEVYAGKMKDAQKLSMEERWERMYNYNDAVENIAAAIRKG